RGRGRHFPALFGTNAMSGPGDKLTLTAKQQRGVLALLSKPTISKAAAEAGVSERCLRKWMQLEAFRTAVRAARQEMFETAVARLVKLAAAAVATLARGLKAAKDADKIRAADLLLRHGRDAVEVDDLARRVRELEQRLQLQGVKR